MKKVPLKILLGNSLLLYLSRWKQHFFAALPPAILAVLVYAMIEIFLHTIRPASWLDPRLRQKVLLAFLVRLVEFCLPWLLTTYAFAAVASLALAGATIQERRIYDAYTLARERIRPILVVGLITFGPALMGGIITLLCAPTLTTAPFVPREYRGVAGQIIVWACLSAWMTLVARTSLSIPWVMDRPEVSAWKAIKTSVPMSDGYESFFFLLIAPNIGLSMLLPWLCRRALLSLWRIGLINADGYSWLAYGMDALSAAAIETVVFVGFSVLYLELRHASREKVQEDGCSEAMTVAPVDPR